jgi:hypothetical protein
MTSAHFRRERMTKKQAPTNPFVPEPAGVPSKNSLRNTVVDQPTPRALPIAEVLGPLQAQAANVMRSSIFNDNVTAETTPVMKRGRSEIGTATVCAQRHQTNMHASVGIEVRCDSDERGDAGCYHVRARVHVAQQGTVETEIPVSIKVKADGFLELDSDQMRKDIISAVRATGQ